MSPCPASSAVGVMLPAVHSGQVGQPRPEPVSRTAPPVTTMTPLAMTLARVIRETTDGFTPERNHAGRTDTRPMLLTAVPLAARPDQPPGAPPAFAARHRREPGDPAPARRAGDCGRVHRRRGRLAGRAWSRAAVRCPAAAPGDPAGG